MYLSKPVFYQDKVSFLNHPRVLLILIVLAVWLPSGHAQPSSVPSSLQVAGSQQLPPAKPATLTCEEAVRLALAQASVYEQAQLSERSANEDVKQAKAAFLPRLTIPSTVIYNSPSPGTTTPSTQSFIGANAITEYQGLVGMSGELDVSGKLRATLRRNRELLAAARAGTELARRALIQATEETYYGLALASARRQAAEQNLAVAEEFARITQLLVTGGEVAQVDLTRARLQVTTRRDELEQARAGEIAAADSLRVLIGYDMTTPVTTLDLAPILPVAGEVERFTTEMIRQRPEFSFFDSQRRAAENEITIARAERRPQLTYSINGGFASDSLRPLPLRSHSGVLATVGVTIPLFDWGASRSREQQAQLRIQTVESARTLTIRGLNQQFNTARAQALSAAERIRIAQGGVADAERNVEVSIVRYRAGEAQIIEVTDAQTTLTAKRAALYQALYDYQVALARLRQAAAQ